MASNWTCGIQNDPNLTNDGKSDPETMNCSEEFAMAAAARPLTFPQLPNRQQPTTAAEATCGQAVDRRQQLMQWGRPPSSGEDPLAAAAAVDD